MPLSTVTLSIMTIRTVTLSITTLRITIKNETRDNGTQHTIMSLSIRTKNATPSITILGLKTLAKNR